ncbi:MAG TPA: response regulator, partial [Longimicrobiales bacterium]|nr:response regulator [Longimicrobiales bacterium]
DSIPTLDGWAVTERLREDPDTAPIPVIILSAHACPKVLARALSVRCDGFLIRPCEPQIVLDEVSRLVGEERPRAS